MLSLQKRVKVAQTVDAAANYSAIAKIPWGVATYDSGGFFNVGSPTKLIIPAVPPAYVMGGCSVDLLGVAASADIQLLITKNGSDDFGRAANCFTGPAAFGARISVAFGPEPGVALDEYEVFLQVAGGAAITIRHLRSCFWLQGLP